jgi:hypothetical protein
MRRDILTEIGFICVIFLLGSGWIAVQVSAYRSQYPAEHPCRVLDIQLDQVQPPNSETTISRVSILTDRDPHYQIESPRTGEPLRVRLSQGNIAPELQKRIEKLNGDPLVEDLWIQPGTNGPLTVEMQLTQPGIRIADSLIHTPQQHGVVLDLIPATHETARQTVPPQNRLKYAPLLLAGTRIPHILLTSACQIVSFPCP